MIGEACGDGHFHIDFAGPAVGEGGSLSGDRMEPRATAALNEVLKRRPIVARFHLVTGMITDMVRIRKASAASTIALALAFGGAAAANAEPSASDGTTTSPAAPIPPTAPVFNVVAKNNTDRADGASSYYVVIDPVDLSDGPAFKQNVKRVLQAIKTSNGTPDFSARIFDDEATAKGYLEDRAESPMDEAVAKDHALQQEQHLVATYAGGLPAGFYPYFLVWFPAASSDSPNVGPYVDIEEWKPATSV